MPIGLSARNTLIALAALGAAFAHAAQAQNARNFTIEQAIDFPFTSDLAVAESKDRIAWVRTVRGVRNIWVADGPVFAPRQVTHYDDDDGQELTQLTFAPDGTALVYVRGGDHDANWPAKGGLAPNPLSAPTPPEVTIWAADLAGKAAPVKVSAGDAPAVSTRGQLAFIKEHQTWTAGLDGSNPHRLFFDRGGDSQLAWSPDGGRLAFVSNRDDHGFVGVFTPPTSSSANATMPLRWLAPSTGFDTSPRWSPDGRNVAFVRRPGAGGPPEPMLQLTPRPWSIWTASVADGGGRLVWRSPNTIRGSMPGTAGGANLHWMADGQLLFLADLDNWPHLYAIPATGGAARLLTPGDFMVEDVAVSRDARSAIYSANAGETADDGDRRHLFRVGLDGVAPRPLTHGETLDWSPAVLGDVVAFIGADPRRPPVLETTTFAGKNRRVLDGQAPSPSFPGSQFIVPNAVTFRAADGLVIHGQLFDKAGGPRKPALLFLHGGPPRQMLLGWHYSPYYTNAYAMNQYLAAHGFTVLSVNYRQGIGYGDDFKNPVHAGAAGASEYQDVLAGARYLQSLPGVDPARIGLWGGSYGGYLTALGLARDSALFKAGVDWHGVHDWNRWQLKVLPSLLDRYEQGDRADWVKTAWSSSPVADIATWTSPVLLIQGDDDRNVPIDQMIDLARRLEAKGTRFEELMIPDEIHGWLRHASLLQADAATVAFLARELRAQ